MNKGFISTYYITVFLLVVSLCAMISLNTQNRLRTTGNMVRVCSYLEAENAVISMVKCSLKNQTEMNGTYQNSDTVFDVRWNHPEILVQIYSPVQESLIITWSQEKNQVYDYEVYRNESGF